MLTRCSCGVEVMTNIAAVEKRSKIDHTKLPYRPGVGLVIINSNRNIFMGKRMDSKSKFAWQMPQGGIDPGETPSKAAMREMKEEIGSDNGTIIAETKNWYMYDIPPHIIPNLWNGAFRGQKQKWFLIRFEGLDEEINIQTHIPEFKMWKWATPRDVCSEVIAFKRHLYRSVLKELEII